jgi:D-alanyl-D-alanine carboxypeptidase/D-alanyl-D-alanine-endopeptidase (penicillin-binding protein 4)
MTARQPAIRPLSTSRGTFLLTLALALGAGGCAAKSASLATASRLAALRTELATIFAAPAFERSMWGVLIQSVDTGDVLFATNPTKLMMPASNMKILVLATSAEQLGWDHTFETRLVTSGAIDGGILKGDLIAIGSGDPSLGIRVGDGGRTLAAWADELWNAGIHTIDGRLIGDDNAFDDEGVGAGWSWDDLAYGYASPVGALAFDENAVELVIRAGVLVGDPPELVLRPVDGGLVVDNQLMTSPPSGKSELDLRRSPGSPRLTVRGAVPAGTPEFARTVSVDNPTDFFLAALRRALEARGITVTGAALDIDVVAPPPDLSHARTLVSHRSPPLSELALPLMKVSRNLYGETLLKTLKTRDGRCGSVQAGREAVAEVLGSWGISPDSVILSDGSGLSRYNYVTVETLVSVLRRLANDPRHAVPFEAALPVAGRDGTLGNRMKGTAAEGNVHAKTGSVSNVRAISGYVRTRDNERLVFSIIANNSNASPLEIDRAADRALERLAEFSRY